MLSALAAKQDALTSSTALSCSTLSASGAITSNGGGFENAGRVNSSGWGAEYAWFSQNVQRWSLYLKPQTSALQMWTNGGGKGFTYEINYGTGHVTFMGGSTNVSDASLKTEPMDANTEDCLQMLRNVSARTYERIDLEPGKKGSALSRKRFGTLPHRHLAASLEHPRTATDGATQSARSSPSITVGCLPCSGSPVARCSPGWKRWRQSLRNR